jgi:excisionase family DNA binding protein
MAEAANSQAKTMTVEEAGKVYFGVSRATAYKLANSGQLPIIRMGRLVRVSVPAMERMLVDAGMDEHDHAPGVPLRAQEGRS